MVTKSTAATYAIISNINLAALLAGTKGEKFWTESKPLKLRILASPTAWSASWTGADRKERYRLISGPGKAVHLVDFAGGTVLPLDKPPRRSPTTGVDAIWNEARHPKFGPTRRGIAYVPLHDGQVALAMIEAQRQTPGASAPFTYLWFTLAPWLGADAVAGLGLPVAVRLERLSDSKENALLQLDSLESVEAGPEAFEVPPNLKQVSPQRRRHRSARQPVTPFPDIPPASAPLPLFTGLGPETVKVVFNQTLVDSVFADLRAVSSYITGFSGERLTFDTSKWFEQIVQNAPVPTDGVSRSVIPALMVRLFLSNVCPMLRHLNLTAADFSGAALPPFTARTRIVRDAAAALPDPEEKSKLEAFLAAVLRSGANSPFNTLLERIVPGLGPSSPPTDDPQINPCALTGLWLEDMPSSNPAFASHHFVLLATLWYGLLLPSITVRPTPLPFLDSFAVFHANGDVSIDEIWDLFDVNLNDFEQSITFGNVPLFSPPRHVDEAAFRSLTTHQPWLAALRNVRFGFLTEVSIPSVEVTFDVDISAADTWETALMGFFCPPCYLSLFGTGIASASIEDTTCLAFIYLEQDPLRLDTPRWRIAFAEPQLGNVDANILFLSGPILLVLVNAIGNIFGGLILNEILKSVIPDQADMINRLLDNVPVLDADTIVRVGKEPGLFSGNEPSRVAYEAPSRSAGGFQFETFRQSTRGRGGRLDFPPAGGTLDTTLAVVLAPHRAERLRAEVDWPGYFGIFNTRKADGSVSEIDWWTEAPDQTGMPPRPPQLQSGPPPGTLLIPQNVGQRWWAFTTLLEVQISWLGFRVLTDSPAEQPVADVLVSAWCKSEAVETEIIMYEDCHDISQLAEELLERWRGSGEPIPHDPRERAGREQPPGPGDPRGILVTGKFLHRLNRPGDPAGPTPGWADDVEVAYWFDSPREMPHPDEAGLTRGPGTGICRTVVTRNTRERETWLEASLQFPLPVLIGLTEELDLKRLEDFVFLPAIHAALGEEDFPPALQFSLSATGPLTTLNLPTNQAWVLDLLLGISTELARSTGISRLGPFHYEYGIESLLATLLPERLQSPLLKLRLTSVTSGATSIAFKFDLQQKLLGRA